MHVALYARVSTTRQAENELSIPDQLRQMHEWAKANGQEWHISLLQVYQSSGAGQSRMFKQKFTNGKV